MRTLVIVAAGFTAGFIGSTILDHTSGQSRRRPPLPTLPGSGETEWPPTGEPGRADIRARPVLHRCAHSALDRTVLPVHRGHAHALGRAGQDGGRAGSSRQQEVGQVR